MKRTFSVIAVLLGWVRVLSAAAEPVEVVSPDGQVRLRLEVQDFEGVAGCPHYSVQYRGKTVIALSRLGLELEHQVLLVDGSPTGGFSIEHIERGDVDSSWKPVYGERNIIRDHYRLAVVGLRQQAPPHRALQLELRAYNEGAAFCYVLPKQPGLTDANIVREITEFRLPSDGDAWATYTAQGPYTKVPVSQVKSGCERPLVVRLADDLYAALAEARLVDYARMKFGPAPIMGSGPIGAQHAAGRSGQSDPTPLPAPRLVAELGGPVTATLPLRTPWRVVMAAESPGRLLENNDVILNLNDPCALPSTEWIKPGKVIREVTLSTLGSKACVDFAVKHHLQYVELDAGWYGPEATGDPRAVSVKADRPQGELDLPEVLRYAKEHQVGIILYVNQKPLERYADEIFPLYKKWGVAGIKFGFVNVGSQQWTAWLHGAVRKAAASELMVDIHDEYRPTGYTRTYPNLVTQEGIRGDEERQPNELQLMSLFCRMLAGPADITVCYYDERVDKQASHAYQLAKAVCFYCPWQFLYWYDRPGNIGRMPASGHNILGDEPELEFFDHCPTVWDDTKVLRGAIGEYGVIARRSGPEWFIGGMNTDRPREFEVPLTFLDAGKRYVAHIYSDDPSLPTRTHVRIDRYLADGGTVLRISMPARGGQAIRIVPATGGETYPAYPSSANSFRGGERDAGTPHATANGKGSVSHTGGAPPSLPAGSPPAFVHPGLLHSKDDLERMKHKVSQRAQPWYAGFEKLRDDSHSRADWRLRGPFAKVVRAPGAGLHIAEMDADANAAYQNALMWCITGNEAHAKKACEILNAWSSQLQEISGSDRELGAALGGFKFVNAAELMRATYPGWSPEEVRACQAMLRRAIYPAIENFATFANGNWDTGCIKTQMAIGVFCDDRKIFDRAVEYFYRGEGNGRLTHYIVDAGGQCQESGRDQTHAQLGLGHLAEACEIGWHQQIDMYGAEDNRLLKGFEYTARYNLGGEVPFKPQVDTTGKYHPMKISDQGRGTLRPIYELVWNHFHQRRGLDAPFTGRAVEKIRPEGAAFDADHPGFGTLLFAEEAAKRPAGAGTAK